jgi:hypothetical protein
LKEAERSKIIARGVEKQQITDSAPKQVHTFSKVVMNVNAN